MIIRSTIEIIFFFNLQGKKFIAILLGYWSFLNYFIIR